MEIVGKVLKQLISIITKQLSTHEDSHESFKTADSNNIKTAEHSWRLETAGKVLLKQLISMCNKIKVFKHHGYLKKNKPYNIHLLFVCKIKTTVLAFTLSKTSEIPSVINKAWLIRSAFSAKTNRFESYNWKSSNWTLSQAVRVLQDTGGKPIQEDKQLYNICFLCTEMRCEFLIISYI